MASECQFSVHTSVGKVDTRTHAVTAHLPGGESKLITGKDTLLRLEKQHGRIQLQIVGKTDGTVQSATSKTASDRELALHAHGLASPDARHARPAHPLPVDDLGVHRNLDWQISTLAIEHQPGEAVYETLLRGPGLPPAGQVVTYRDDADARRGHALLREFADSGAAPALLTVTLNLSTGATGTVWTPPADSPFRTEAAATGQPPQEQRAQDAADQAAAEDRAATDRLLRSVQAMVDVDELTLLRGNADGEEVLADVRYILGQMGGAVRDNSDVRVRGEILQSYRRTTLRAIESKHEELVVATSRAEGNASDAAIDAARAARRLQDTQAELDAARSKVRALRDELANPGRDSYGPEILANHVRLAEAEVDKVEYLERRAQEAITEAQNDVARFERRRQEALGQREALERAAQRLEDEFARLARELS